MADQSYRVVLDTNQVVGAGSRWLDHGVPTPDPNMYRRIVIRVAQSHTGLYSGKVIGEYLEKLIDLNHPPERAGRMITYLIGAFTRVEITTEEAPFRPSDLDDEIFILCAIDGDADYLISEDASLLDLVANYKKPSIGAAASLLVQLGA